jgi:hypothetical protein
MTPDERLDAVVLARLATARKATRGEVARAIARFAPSSIEPKVWDAQIDAALQRLDVANALDDPKAVWSPFGSKSAVPWKRLVERVIPALALGVAPDDLKAHGRLGDRDAWAAAIVARDQRIWTEGPPPTLPALCDQLVWRGLGLTGKAKRTPPEIRALFVDRLLGDVAVGGTFDRSVRVLAAHVVGAPRSDLRALRDALGRRWLIGETRSTPSSSSHANGDLASLARAVANAARDATDGVFGDRKVFIASVWRSLAGRPPIDRMDLDAFKRRLVEAHRAGLVSLVRADLVGVMDPEQVAASETVSGDARFHFVVREVPS